MNTIELLRADRNGIPTRAECAGCGALWERGAYDVTAAGLVLFSLEHRDCGDLGDLEADRTP